MIRREECYGFACPLSTLDLRQCVTTLWGYSCPFWVATNETHVCGSLSVDPCPVQSYGGCIAVPSPSSGAKSQKITEWQVDIREWQRTFTSATKHYNNISDIRKDCLPRRSETTILLYSQARMVATSNSYSFSSYKYMHKNGIYKKKIKEQIKRRVRWEYQRCRS